MGLRSEELDEQLIADIRKALERCLNSKEDNSKRHHNKNSIFEVDQIVVLPNGTEVQRKKKTKINNKKKTPKESRKITLRLSEDEYNRLHFSLESRKNGPLTKKAEKEFISKMQMKMKKQHQKYKGQNEETLYEHFKRMEKGDE